MDEDLKELISCFSNLTEDEKMSEISKKVVDLINTLKDITEEEKNYEYKKTPKDIFMNLCILEDTIGKSLMVTSSLNE